MEKTNNVVVIPFIDASGDDAFESDRYAIAVREKNGKFRVIDDAQGWGYRTKESAVAAYMYKKKKKEAEKTQAKTSVDREIDKTIEEIDIVIKKYMGLKKRLDDLRNMKRKEDIEVVTKAFLDSGKSTEEVIKFLQS